MPFVDLDGGVFADLDGGVGILDDLAVFDLPKILFILYICEVRLLGCLLLGSKDKGMKKGDDDANDDNNNYRMCCCLVVLW
jgi:hypothetical protein